MALGDLEVKGKLKVVGTTEMAGFAKDATLITNLNADKVDSADLDVDGTLAANSDVKIPSQKAVKTYAAALTGDQTVAGVKTFSSIPVLPASDPTTANQAARKAYVDGATVVHTTGDQTIAGVKTFSSIPVLPDSAITGAKIAKAFDSGGNEVIGVSSSWTPPAGIYMWCFGSASGAVTVQIYQGGAWRGMSGSSNVDYSGMMITDGTNIRFKNNRSDISVTVYYLKLA